MLAFNYQLPIINYHLLSVVEEEGVGSREWGGVVEKGARCSHYLFIFRI